MTNYDEMTSDELRKELERRDALRTVREDASGVIITTPNASYTGETRGVRFYNGRAFLPRPDDSDLEAISDWSEIVTDLQHVYGYNVQDGTLAEFNASA